MFFQVIAQSVCLSNFEKLLKRIEKNDPSLSEIDIIEKSIDSSDTKKLAKALQKNTVVTTVKINPSNIRNYGIGDYGAIAFAQMLESNTSIHTLFIDGSFGVHDIGAKALANMLMKNKTLKNITLIETVITDSGLMALANALKINKTITHFSIYSSPSVTKKGTGALAKALEHNQTLTTLDIGHTDVDWKALTNMLKVNKKLKSLWCYNVDITQKELINLAHTLEKNTALKEMHLLSAGGSIIGDVNQCLDAFIKMLQVNKTITVIDLDMICESIKQKKVSQDKIDTLQKLVERNKLLHQKS